jgi:hypothetical protein
MKRKLFAAKQKLDLARVTCSRQIQSREANTPLTFIHQRDKDAY